MALSMPSAFFNATAYLDEGNGGLYFWSEIGDIHLCSSGCLGHETGARIHIWCFWLR